RIAGRILASVLEELPIEPDQEAPLLEVVEEIVGLRVVGPRILVVERVVRSGGEGPERGDALSLDRALEPNEAPVGVPVYAAALIARLLVERSHALVEPGQAVQEIGLHEGV